MMSLLRGRFDGEASDSKLAMSMMSAMDSWSPSGAVSEDIRTAFPGVTPAEMERPTCAFDGCAAGWSKLWKRRSRPMFEGGWGCSKSCVRGLVATRVRHEMEGADGADTAMSHSHRVPLGLTLLAQGLVTQEQLRTALEAQKSAGHGRIGEWLVEAAGVAPAKITRGLGMQWQCPVLGLGGFDAMHMAMAMPVALRQMCHVAPLRVAGGRILYIAFDESVDAAAAFALERMSGLIVESGVLPGGEFLQALDGLNHCDAVACRQVDVADFETLVDQVAETLVKLQPVASKLVRLRDRYWLRMWLERGAYGKNGTLPASGEDVADVLLRICR
jgi:hypothetical protein